MGIISNTLPIASPLGQNFQSLYSFGCHVAISSDGKKIVTFNPDTSEFKIYKDDNLTQHSLKFIYNTGEDENSNQTICWSLAISNCIDGHDRLIALSRFDPRDILQETDPKSSLADEEAGTTHTVTSRTWIISESSQTEIPNFSQNIGGVVRFLESDIEISGQAQIVVVNASGIYKTTIKNKITIIKNHFCIPTTLFWNEARSVEQFYLPKQLSVSLSSSDRWESGLILLHTSIIKNHFMIGDYKDQRQAVEMYSLITGDLEMVFQKREPSYSPTVPKGNSIFAISRNEAMLAFCRGNNAITIYLMENGLEITTKELDGHGLNKIMSLDFIDNDNKLLVILEKERGSENDDEKYHVFVVWDLFSTSNSAIRQVEYSGTQNYPLNADAAHRLINSQGRILAVTNWGGIFSLLEQPNIAAILNHTPSSRLISLDLPAHENSDIDHPVFLLSGKRIDKTVEQKAIINEIEPWHPDKQYPRLFVFLDNSKKTQLIIGPNTVQVWRLRKDKYSRYQRTLEFIWAKKNIGKSRIRISHLQIGHCEFVLTLSIPSSKKGDITKSHTIHWPNNENILRSACRGINFLVDMKQFTVGNRNANRCEYLIDHTQQLIKSFIKKHSLFRLTDIRYNIMKDLIQAHQESLIKSILSENIKGKNSRIHIPRLYEWAKPPLGIHNDSTYPKLKQKTLTDLQCAIEHAESFVGSAAIVEHLLEYYTDNASDFNNPGWMFTVTSAIPYLYKHNLGDLVLKIFKKPCFGTTEAYMPPLHINNEDQKAGNETDSVYVINARPRLARKPEPKFLDRIAMALREKIGSNRTQERAVPNQPVKKVRIFGDRKVYMVPLPDFTVYPRGLTDYNHDKTRLPLQLLRILFWPRLRVIFDEKDYSPFLHVIDHEKDPDFYNVPSMNAVTEFKWTDARKYFARQVTIYILFAISFMIRSIFYITDAPLQAVYYKLPHADTGYSLALIFMIYFGFYLLATEIVQMKRMGLVKYTSHYNFFDLVSIIAPLTTVGIKEGLINIGSESFQIILAFTVLIMWMQLLMLMRYFKYAGHYIYIIIHILNTIWPFFAFMLIVVIGFGHAMFVLLHKSDPSSFRIDTYSVVDPNNVTNNLFPNYQIQHQVDQNSRLDNYYAYFFSSVEAVFFWTNGRWDQINQWDNRALDVMTILGSLVLVLIFQNMLIAFMNGAFDSANEHGRNAVQNFRADLISEYETLEKPFCRRFRNPRYIYYIPSPSLVNTWLSEIAKEKEKNDGGNFNENDDFDSGLEFYEVYYARSSDSELRRDTCITFFDEEHKPSLSSLPPNITGPGDITHLTSALINIHNDNTNTLVESVSDDTLGSIEPTDSESSGPIDNEELLREKLWNLEDGITQRLKVEFSERLNNIENLLLSLKRS